MLAKRVHNGAKNSMLGRSSGKGKDILSKTNTSRYNKSQLIESSDAESSVTLPYLKPSENAELLPCYASVLTRSVEEGIGMKDLDQLQQELEKLLSVSAVRHRLLCSELDIIDRVEERVEKKGKVFDKPPSPKHRKIEEKPKHSKDPKPAYKVAKNSHDELPKAEVPKIVLPKNDTKSKFWLSVDPFCAPVSRDDIAYLDDLMQECSKDVDLKIPEVGQHYVDEWNVEHQEQSSAVAPRPGKSKGIVATTNGFAAKKNGFFVAEPYTNSVILPLASALLEENVNNLPGSQEKLKEIGMKPMNNGGVCIDKRLRNELVELGILEPEDDPKSIMEEDEIVQEIKLCHSELCTLNEHNRRELNRLRNLVNKDITRQEFVQNLDEVDNKVMEVYNKLLAANSKERNHIEWEAVRIVQMQKQLHNEATEITDFVI